MKKEKIKKIARKYGIKMLVIFGSAATDMLRKDSDIDLAYLSERAFSLKEEIKLRHELANIYKREVDLVNFTSISPLLAGEIAKKGLCVFGSEKKYREIKIHFLKKFIDFKPYFLLREKILDKQINNAK